MSLLKYLRSKHNLPDPKGSLSTKIPERAISSANQQVGREIESGCKKKKQGTIQQLLPFPNLVASHICISFLTQC